MTFNVAIMFAHFETDRVPEWSLRQWTVGAPDITTAMQMASANAAEVIPAGWVMSGEPTAWPMGSVISR
jgi:hypothetical protein